MGVGKETATQSDIIKADQSNWADFNTIQTETFRRQRPKNKLFDIVYSRTNNVHVALLNTNKCMSSQFT